MKAIVNVDKNWNIGYKGNLLLHFKEDMNFFKEKTISNVCIMGRKTLESFPNKMPLPDRLNIVLTSNIQKYEEMYKNIPNILFFDSKEKILEHIKSIKDKDIYVLGGQTIYKSFLYDCDIIYVTKMDREFEADTSFPNLDNNSSFKIKTQTELLYNEKNNLNYRMITYERIN